MKADLASASRGILPLVLRPPRYLFVCTANMNRSVIGAAWCEQMMAQRFVAAEVRSAGAQAWPGQPAAAYAVDAMREHGFDLRSHRTRLLTAAMIRDTDRVVIMEPAHGEAVVLLDPAVTEKIVPFWTWIGDGHESVPDPHGQELDTYRAAVLQIRDASARFVAAELDALRARRTPR